MCSSDLPRRLKCTAQYQALRAAFERVIAYTGDRQVRLVILRMTSMVVPEPAQILPLLMVEMWDRVARGARGENPLVFNEGISDKRQS